MLSFEQVPTLPLLTLPHHILLHVNTEEGLKNVINNTATGQIYKMPSNLTVLHTGRTGEQTAASLVCPLYLTLNEV